MNCSQCESTLLVEIFGTSNPIRCASCGTVSYPVTEAASQTSRFAWRSLWLGLASIILLFLTGIPAIWYGVRSLLQMRFVRTTKGDRKAAVVGVTLGVLFGVLWAGIVTILGAGVLLFMMMLEETKDSARIEQILSTIGSLEVPEEFVPDEAQVLMSQSQRVDWRDYSDTNIDDGRMRVIRATANTQIGDQQIIGPGIRFSLDRDIEIESANRTTETVSWVFAGRTRSIDKISNPVKNADFKVVRYIGKTEDDEFPENQVYVLAVSIRDDGEHSEEDIKKIFESFVPSDS